MTKINNPEPLNRTEQHSTLMTLNQQGLSVTFIPRQGKPDWVVPTALILAIENCDKVVENYTWQGHNIAVFNLLPTASQNDIKPEKLVILEGEEDQQRIGLLIQGELSQQQIRPADIKDNESSSLSTTVEPDFSYQQVIIYDQLNHELHNQCYTVPDLKQLLAYLTQRRERP